MKFLLILILLSFNLNASPLIWRGNEIATGTNIEIGTDNLVRTGKEIEIFDFVTGNFHKVEVQTIKSLGSSGTEIEVYDFETNKVRTFEMEYAN